MYNRIKSGSGFFLLQINVWSYSTRKLLHSIETGHTTNIFCTKFVPETSDELVVSGAGDAEVNYSHVDDYMHIYKHFSGLMITAPVYSNAWSSHMAGSSFQFVSFEGERS